MSTPFSGELVLVEAISGFTISWIIVSKYVVEN